MQANKITPSLWYVKEAEQAAKFYVSIFPDSRIDRVATLPAETPSGPPGSVVIVDFTLFGQPFMAMSAGEMDNFNHAISFTVKCETQDEIDRYWNALTADGGTAEACGWVRDRYGVVWQIVPRVMADMIADPDRAKGKRVTEAMLEMQKLDLPALERAYRG